MHLAATSHFVKLGAISAEPLERRLAMTWIKTSERLPNIKNEYVLFWDSEVCLNVPCFGRLNENGEWLDDSSSDNCGDPSPRYCVTHWMPLPEAPTAEPRESAPKSA